MACENCGARAGLGKLILANGDELCRKCAEKIPKMWRDYAETNWTVEEYKDFLDYKNPDYTETDKLGGLSLDRRGYIKIDGVVIPASEIEGYDFAFGVSSFKKGLIADKVSGEGRFRVSIRRPSITRTLSLGILTSSAQKRNDGIKYEIPKNLQKMQALLSRMTQQIPEEPYQGAGQNTYQNSSQNTAQPRRDKEFEDALTLFMFDSLDNITAVELRSQRNRLIKTFHTDAGGETEQAEKINAAYEVLKRHLPKDD